MSTPDWPQPAEEDRKDNDCDDEDLQADRQVETLKPPNHLDLHLLTFMCVSFAMTTVYGGSPFSFFQFLLALLDP